MVKFISITPESEQLIAYCARVSNPSNQSNKDVSKLFSYCIKNGHWSIFEMSNMILEVETSRAIAAQILRHKSMNFQEFSQRYSDAQDFEIYEARRQDVKNRQNSIDDLPEETKKWFIEMQDYLGTMAISVYQDALHRGVAKECARFLLPLSTKTKMYVNGNIRSWIHYINLRTDKSTQLEHRLIAEECKKIFCEQLPSIAKALGWVDV